MMEKDLMRETGLSFIIISSTFFALFASAIIIRVVCGMTLMSMYLSRSTKISQKYNRVKLF